MAENESAPLLSAAADAAPPQYSDVTTQNPSSNLERPPPYNLVAPVSSPSPSNLEQFGGGNSLGNSSLYVQCRVCQHIINVQHGTTARVVKCSNCQEATPITDPPPGKKYVRCPCNCLLTCTSTASRVICPRPNCKRTIGVGSTDTLTPVSGSRIRVICGRCNRSILWPPNENVARCPHCRCRSYLRRDWMMRRAVISAVLGFILLAIGIGVTVSRLHHGSCTTTSCLVASKT